MRADLNDVIHTYVEDSNDESKKSRIPSTRSHIPITSPTATAPPPHTSARVRWRRPIARAVPSLVTAWLFKITHLTNPPRAVRVTSDFDTNESRRTVQKRRSVRRFTGGLRRRIVDSCAITKFVQKHVSAFVSIVLRYLSTT